MRIMWALLQECENQEVIPKVIDFMIEVHLSLSEEISLQRKEILTEFLHKCMALLKDSKEGSAESIGKGRKILALFKALINETEKHGASEVQPHGSLMRGEALAPFHVKNKVTLRGGELLIRAFGNTTLWELKKEIASSVDYNPAFINLQVGSGAGSSNLESRDNGKTINELGLKGGETITVTKNISEKNIANLPLVDKDRNLVPEAEKIFKEWYNYFLTDEGKFTKESTAQFI